MNNLKNKMFIRAAALSSAAQAVTTSYKRTIYDYNLLSAIDTDAVAEAAEQFARKAIQDHWGITDDELTARLQKIESANGWDGLLAGTVWQHVLHGYEFDEDGKLTQVFPQPFAYYCDFRLKRDIRFGDVK